MNILKLSAGVFAAAVFFTSCTIEQNFHFRNDFSGSYEIKVDMSAMEAFGDMDSTATTEEPDSMFTAEDIREFRTHYNGIDGITNADASYNEGVLDASYDFANLDALNRAQASSPDGDMEGEEEGTESPRLFIFKRTSNGLEIEVDRGFMNSETEESTAEDIEMMDGMLTISGIMTFEKPVKSVKGDIATLDNESNTVTIKVLFSDIYNKDKNLTTVIGF